MFTQLSDRIWYMEQMVETDRPHLGYIRGDRYSLMVDAGNSPAHLALFLAELKRAGLKSPDFIGITHWHWDHTFGMCAARVPTIASRRTDRHLRRIMEWKWDDASMEERLRTREDTEFSTALIRKEYPDRSLIRVVPADIVFTERLSVDLGGVSCEMILLEGPHSEDGVIYFLPEERFVFLGDSPGKDLMGLDWHYDPAHPERIKELLAPLPYDPARLRPYIEYLEGLDFKHALASHDDLYTRESLFSDRKKYY